MNENYLDLSALSRENPASDAEREAHHQLLATLLSAYADGELPTETTSQIDAHLLGCARCRREVGVHRALRDRMREVRAAHDATGPSALLHAAATDVLDARIMARVAALPASHAPVQALPSAARRSVRRLLWASVAVLVCLTVLFLGWQSVRRPAVMGPVVVAESVPLLASVAQDYRRTMASELPGRARDLDAVRGAMPFVVEPLSLPALRLLAVWTTELGGQPAAVLAYRWNDRILLQYVVAEDVLFRHPGLRTQLAAHRRVAGTAGTQGMLAWALPAAGTVLIGDVTAADLGGLWAGVSGR